MLGIQHGMSVLDVGSSVGFWARHTVDIVGPTGKVVAIDKDANIIKRLNRDAAELGRENLHGITGDILNLHDVPLKKELFDRVLLIRMIPVVETVMNHVIPELVDFTNSRGAVIVIDAMHYKKELELFLNNHRDIFEYSFIDEIESRSDEYFFGVRINRID